MTARLKPAPPLPDKDGVGASHLWLPDGVWPDLLTFLVQHFPAVTRATWQARLDKGEVRERSGERLHAGSAVRRGMCIFYYRELDAETAIPFEETVLYQDQYLLVIDKPHFLPVAPVGRFLQETLLVRLKKKLGLPHLAPLHRLDRETAGVVMFSVDPATRGVYHALFEQRHIAKRYEAWAPALAPALARSLPLVHRSRMDHGTPFFCMREVAGEPNSETRIAVLEARGGAVLYDLQPLTGRQHQLRVHMAALGSPIFNDDFYPLVRPCKGDDFSRPLQLLARAIAFTDPLSGAERHFESRRTLDGGGAF
jgi:tRNA pseudouridine32 synthase/23S rRNA pseudouridine746 synthase